MIALLDCKIPVKCHDLHVRSAKICGKLQQLYLQKCKMLYPGQRPQEMWGGTHSACTTDSHYQEIFTGLPTLPRKKYWGINLVIGYRSTTEKNSQTSILVVISAAKMAHSFYLSWCLRKVVVYWNLQHKQGFRVAMARNPRNPLKWPKRAWFPG